MRDYIYYAIKEIRRRKFRTLANVMGYVIGVAFMIALVSLSQAYSISAKSVLEGIGVHFMVYTPDTLTCEPRDCAPVEVGPFIEDTYTKTFNESILEAISNLPGVRDAAPYLSLKLDLFIIGGIEIDKLATNLVAVSPVDIVDGNYLEAGDEDAVMLDMNFAKLSALDIGDTLDIFNHTFNIVGIVDTRRSSLPGGQASVYMHIIAVKKLALYFSPKFELDWILWERDINAVLVEASAGTVKDINNLRDEVMEIMRSYVGEVSLSGYNCDIPARNVASTTEKYAWAISLILVLSVVLFSLKSQLGSVVERTKEIGILRAIGWADSDFMKQLLMESLLQGFAGGLIGCILGCSITFLILLFGYVSVETPFFISPSVIIVGLIASLVGGTIAGIFSAWRAVKLRPVEAFRRF